MKKIKSISILILVLFLALALGVFLGREVGRFSGVAKTLELIVEPVGDLEGWYTIFRVNHKGLEILKEIGTVGIAGNVLDYEDSNKFPALLVRDRGGTVFLPPIKKDGPRDKSSLEEYLKSRGSHATFFVAIETHRWERHRSGK